MQITAPMLAAQSAVDPSLTTRGVFLLALGGVVLLWLVALTIVVMRRREPWHDDGAPVFRRMPDGRVRFSWGIASGLGKAQRASAAMDLRSRQPPRAPARIIPEGGAHASH